MFPKTISVEWSMILSFKKFKNLIAKIQKMSMNKMKKTIQKSHFKSICESFFIKFSQKVSKKRK